MSICPQPMNNLERRLVVGHAVRMTALRTEN